MVRSRRERPSRMLSQQADRRLQHVVGGQHVVAKSLAAALDVPGQSHLLVAVEHGNLAHLHQVDADRIVDLVVVAGLFFGGLVPQAGLQARRPPGLRRCRSRRPAGPRFRPRRPAGGQVRPRTATSSPPEVWWTGDEIRLRWSSWTRAAWVGLSTRQIPQIPRNERERPAATGRTARTSREAVRVPKSALAGIRRRNVFCGNRLQFSIGFHAAVFPCGTWHRIIMAAFGALRL